jgi:hypothetical protein
MRTRQVRQIWDARWQDIEPVMRKLEKSEGPRPKRR